MKKMIVIYFLVGLINVLSAQTVDVGFSARGKDPSAQTLIIRAIDSAKIEIRMAAYNFTDKQIIQALLEASKRGVNVQIVHDSTASKEKGDGTEEIQAGGGKIRLNSKYKILHDKFIIIDKVTVETGSYNYSKNANIENAENVIVLWNFPEVAKKYLVTWNKLWEEGE